MTFVDSTAGRCRWPGRLDQGAGSHQQPRTSAFAGHTTYGYPAPTVGPEGVSVGGRGMELGTSPPETERAGTGATPPRPGVSAVGISHRRVSVSTTSTSTSAQLHPAVWPTLLRKLSVKKG